LKAFTAMALGARPVGMMVKREREAVRTTAMSEERASTTKSRRPEEEKARAEGPSPTRIEPPWRTGRRLPSSMA
jgi:hypothetical protein